MPGYYAFDWTYLVLVLPVVLLAFWAQINVQTTYKKYAKIRLQNSMTAEEAARMILDSHGLYGVRIERIAGQLTDHFDPSSNVLRLSESVYGSDSAAAGGVAAHEAGHAAQYPEQYTPMKLRAAIIPVSRIGSQLAMPLFLLGLLFSFPSLCYAGIIFFALAMLFQAVTLPVEFDASRRALAALGDSDRFSDNELKASKKVLTAAALTYVAALAVSLVQLLRLIIIAGGRNRKN